MEACARSRIRHRVEGRRLPPEGIGVRAPTESDLGPVGHCTTSDIEQAIQDGHDTIMVFLEEETASFLTLD